MRRGTADDPAARRALDGAFRGAYDALRARLGDTALQSDCAERERDRLRAELGALRAQHEGLRDEIAVLQSRNAGARAGAVQRQREIDDGERVLRRAIEELRAAAARRGIELSRLAQRVAQKDAQLVQLDERAAHLEEAQEQRRGAAEEFLFALRPESSVAPPNASGAASAPPFAAPSDAPRANAADFARLIAENDALDSAALRQRREQLLL